MTGNTYILSAGWGLINSEFLTPYYDITFSAAADNYKRRRKADTYRDFCMLPEDVDELIVFFGRQGLPAAFLRAHEVDEVQEDSVL